jgi:uncharacterized repeat protein (TIGR01451 family)
LFSKFLTLSVLTLPLLTACETRTGKSPVILSVEPTSGNNQVDTPVRILGSHFFVEAEVNLGEQEKANLDATFSVSLGSAALTDVTYVSVTEITAIVPAGLIPALYDLTVTAPSGKTSTLPEAFTVVQPPLTVTSFIASPTPVSVGQTATLTIVVRNSGLVDLHDVVVPTPIAVGSTATPVGTSVPAAVDLAIGDQASFVWIYSMTGPGDVSFSAIARGVDSASGDTLTSAPAPSNTISVLRPGQLVVELSPDPLIVTEGQQITLTMNVTNSGEVDVDDVIADTLTTSGTATVDAPLGPVPPSIATIAPTMTESLTWTLSTKAGDGGTVSFIGSVSGKDGLSGNDVMSVPNSSASVVIQTPPSVSLAVNAPNTVGQGQSGVLVRVTATNSGEAGVSFGSSDAEIMMSPTQSDFTITRTDTVDVIPGGESRTLTFSVDVDAGAALSLRTIDAQLVATDINTSSDASVFFGNGATVTDSWNVLGPGVPAALSVTLEPSSPNGALDGIVSSSQQFAVTAVVENAGSCNVDATGQIVFDLGTSGSLTSESLTRTLVVGSPEVLVLDSAPTAIPPGSIQVSIVTTPTDLCSATPAAVTAPGTASTSIQTVAAASLAVIAEIVSPAASLDGVVDVDSTFQIDVTVTNTGTAAVTGAAEIALELGATGVSLVSPSSLTQALTLGTPVSFVFQAPAVATPTDSITASISTIPMDENTNAAATTGSAATVQISTVIPCSPTCGACGSGCCVEACAGNCDCTGACVCDLDCSGGNNCGGTCDTVSACSINCAGNTGLCSPQCVDGATCDVDCTGAEDCKPVCKNDAVCDFDCTDGTGQCKPVCDNDATCTVDCQNSADCQPDCKGNASCTLDCSEAPARCEFKGCGGTELSCPGGIIVCNALCP